VDRHLLALRNFAQQIPTTLTNVAAQYRKSSLATWYQLAQQGDGGGQVLFSIIIIGALVSIIPASRCSCCCSGFGRTTSPPAP